MALVLYAIPKYCLEKKRKAAKRAIFKEKDAERKSFVRIWKERTGKGICSGWPNS